MRESNVTTMKKRRMGHNKSKKVFKRENNSLEKEFRKIKFSAIGGSLSLKGLKLIVLESTQ
jgi:hypothetical protein